VLGEDEVTVLTGQGRAVLRGPNLEHAFWETSMSSKKKNQANPGTNSQALKIGSRVRCTDDGVEGRIVWANAVSLMIRWDDGEQITWRRDSLAERPIEILDESDDQSTSAVQPVATEQSEPIESPLAVPEEAPTMPATEPSTLQSDPSVIESTGEPIVTAINSTDQHSESPGEPIESSVTVAAEMTPAADTHVEEATLSEPAREDQKTPEHIAEQPQATLATARRPRQRNPKKAAEDGTEKKLSALDAAAKVLAETGTAMTCQEMIAAMAAKGYWTSPAGRTPQSTLYSAMLREITAKGTNGRFQKSDRGKFCRNKVV
jgi:hypothetical protein